MWNENGTAISLHNREGVPKGGPLAIVTYGIGVLPLIKQMKTAYLDVIQTWYDDNLGALGTYKNIRLYFISLKQFFPGHGYSPKPSKSVLIAHLDDPETIRLFGLRHGFKVCTAARYLDGFIGDDESACYWLQDHTFKWEKEIRSIREIVDK